MNLQLFFNFVLGCAIVVWIPLVLAHVDASFRRFSLLHAASLAGLISLFFEPGSWPSLVMGSAWVAVGILLGVLAFRRLAFWGLIGGARTNAAYALIGFGGGVVWFFAARTGAPFMGFAEPWKTLTAIHFHYAGALVPLIYALMLARVEDRGRAQEGRWGAWALRLWFVGFAFVAAGINGSPMAEKIGALAMFCAGLILIVISVRTHTIIARGMTSKLLLSLSVLAGTGALTLAVFYAFKIGALAEFSAMAETHGILNSFVWTPALVFLMILNVWSVGESSERLPFARWAAGPIVGADFFESAIVPGAARGLTDRFAELSREEFSVALVDPGVIEFYESTADFELDVRAQSAAWFAFVWRKWAGPWFGRREQLHLPDRDKKIAGRIVMLDEKRDGRERPRGWVRTDVATGKAVYVAAYAVHTRRLASYMNIAFPLPFGNMTSILLPVHHPVKTAGIVLTTQPAARPFGDQGVFAVVGGFGIRLPLNETIEVWREDQALRAEHRMWFCGWPYLTLSYLMRRKE